MFNNVYRHGVKIPKRILNYKGLSGGRDLQGAMRKELAPFDDSGRESPGVIDPSYVTQFDASQSSIPGVRPIAKRPLAMVPLSYYTHRFEDADTIALSDGHGNPEVKVRLAGLDAPEVGHDHHSTYRKEGQPWGDKATDEAAARLASLQNPVMILDPEEMSYGRYVGVIASGDLTRNLNMEIIRGGLAQFLPYGSKEDSMVDWDELAASEVKARTEGRGMWSHPEWRAYDWLRAGAGVSLTFNQMNDLGILSEDLDFAAAVSFIEGAKDTEEDRSKAFRLGSQLQIKERLGSKDAPPFIPATSMENIKLTDNASAKRERGMPGWVVPTLATAATLGTAAYFGWKTYDPDGIESWLKSFSSGSMKKFFDKFSTAGGLVRHGVEEYEGTVEGGIAAKVAHFIRHSMDKMEAYKKLMTTSDRLWTDIETTGVTDLDKITQIASLHQKDGKIVSKTLYTSFNEEIHQLLQDQISSTTNSTRTKEMFSGFLDFMKSHYEKVESIDVDTGKTVSKWVAKSQQFTNAEGTTMHFFTDTRDALFAWHKELRDTSEATIVGYNVREFDNRWLTKYLNNAYEFDSISSEAATRFRNEMTGRIRKSIDLSDITKRLAGDAGFTTGLDNKTVYGWKNEAISKLLGFSDRSWHDPIQDLLGNIDIIDKLKELRGSSHIADSLNIKGWVQSNIETGKELSYGRKAQALFDTLGEPDKVTLQSTASITGLNWLHPGIRKSITTPLRMINPESMVNNYEWIKSSIDEKVAPMMKKMNPEISDDDLAKASEVLSGVTYGASFASPFVAVGGGALYLSSYTYKKAMQEDAETPEELQHQAYEADKKMDEHRKRIKPSNNVNGMASYHYRNRKRSHHMKRTAPVCSACAGTGCRFCGG